MDRRKLCLCLAVLVLAPGPGAVRAREELISRQQKQAATDVFVTGLQLAAVIQDEKQRQKMVKAQVDAATAAQRMAASMERQERGRTTSSVSNDDAAPQPGQARGSAFSEAGLAAARRERESREALEAQASASVAAARQELIVKARAEWTVITELEGDARAQRQALVAAMLNQQYREPTLLEDRAFSLIFRSAVELYLEEHASPVLRFLAAAQSDPAYDEAPCTRREVYLSRFDDELVLLSVTPRARFTGSADTVKGLLDELGVKARGIVAARAAVGTAQAGSPTPVGPEPKRPFVRSIFEPGGKRKTAEEAAAYEAAMSAHRTAVAEYDRLSAARLQRIRQAEAALGGVDAEFEAAKRKLLAAVGKVEFATTVVPGRTRVATISVDDLNRSGE